MASAGQAQAHSSQPMHFSSPSGHRLSWWWPWNRGAVGRLSSGYWTVSTFRNISVNVTPNPLTGLRISLIQSRKSGTGDLRGRVPLGPLPPRALPHREQREDEHEDHAEDHVGGRAAAVHPPGAHG